MFPTSQIKTQTAQNMSKGIRKSKSNEYGSLKRFTSIFNRPWTETFLSFFNIQLFFNHLNLFTYSARITSAHLQYFLESSPIL